MKRIILVRHGNTFGPDETPRRVGLKTDIPLVESGQRQAQKLGELFKERGYVFDAAYTSTLKRTIETAQIALTAAGQNIQTQPLSLFDEIDYGPDENKPEDEVTARIGEQALKDWNNKALVPDGWLVDPDEIISGLKTFAADLLSSEHQTILAVTSNGIARLAPHLTGDFEGFAAHHKIKLSTGAFAVLDHDGQSWTIPEWNIRP